MKTKARVYDRLLTAGREMSEGEIAGSIRTLAADPRFAALAALIDRNGRDYARAGSAQDKAQFHGVIAHCAGSVHAMATLEGQLRQIVDPPEDGARPQRARDE